MAFGSAPVNKIVCRPELSTTNRDALADRLRTITGWEGLSFDRDGSLEFRNSDNVVGGSNSARELLKAANSEDTIVVIEDASNRPDVVFAKVIDGLWSRGASSNPPVQIILIDFDDFTHVFGDESALSAFNEGWAMLHELAHIVHNSADGLHDNGPGECESLINEMRRECGLPERAEYYFNYFPGQTDSHFATRLVRLAFDMQSSRSSKKKRSWIMWDATIVGGTNHAAQVARN